MFIMILFLYNYSQLSKGWSFEFVRVCFQFLFILCTEFQWLCQNKEVTDAIQKVADAYDCKIVEGVLSHQLKQFVIDGNKAVLSASSGETRVDDAEFEENEVYAVDIVTSTGDGKVSLDVNALFFSPI